MNLTFRCDCPITSALDILGDKWILVLVKMMLIEGMYTFKDFSDSEEAIATNILASKLKLLEELHFITKSKLPNNKKTNLYFLTDKGLDLIPIIVELALFSDHHIRALNPSMLNEKALQMMKTDKVGVIQMLAENYRATRTKMLNP